jgi:hypothetical protein
MVGVHYLSLLSIVASIILAQDPFYMCTVNKCENAPRQSPALVLDIQTV